MSNPTSGQTQELTLTSRENGFLGASLRVKLQAEGAGNGMYRIARDEWDRTLGPIFDRLAHAMTLNKRSEPTQDTPMGVYEAYGAMNPAQAQSYHTLVQAFNAAKDPTATSHFSGDYAAKIAEFGRELQGGHVLASRTQLEGLTAVARAAATFAKEDTKFDKIDAFWQTHVHENPRMSYKHGILNHLT